MKFTGVGRWMGWVGCALLIIAAPTAERSGAQEMPAGGESEPWFARGNPFTRRAPGPQPLPMQQEYDARPMAEPNHVDSAVVPAAHMQSLAAEPSRQQPLATPPNVPLLAEQPLAAQPMNPQPMAQQPMATQPVSAQPMNSVGPPADGVGQFGPAAGGQPQGTGWLVAPQSGEHPLTPAVRWASEALPMMDQHLSDYVCTLAKRERVGGTLGDLEYIYCKIRHQPFSAYLNFLGPEAVKGQEALYVEGRNDGNMLAHGAGLKHRLLGTVTLDPNSTLAMNGNRHPITQIGFRRLTERLLNTWQHDMQYGESEVQYLAGAKVNGRSCTCIQVAHPTPRREFAHYLTRLYVDDEWNVPIRYEAYDWPQTQGGQPLLVEEYTYANLKLNAGLTDRDFDPANPDYQF